MEHTNDTDPAAAYFARQPRIKILDVEYFHLQLADGSDLYVTEHGRPFMRQLLPENHWSDRDWFAGHSAKLCGTGSLYRITTKEVAGVSRDIVLKWNRMGEDIPGETQASGMDTAKFNSPFEEFSLVIEMRNVRGGADGLIRTHKPLAIYVPRKYVDAERMGRKRYILDAVQRKHEEITLDQNRQYAVIYEWVKGIDAAEAFGEGMIDKEEMRDLTLRSNQEMLQKGFVVRDSKPHHVIVRPKGDQELSKDRNGEILYALVDFELLERTPEREQSVRASKRRAYLQQQAHRFEAVCEFPPGLTQMTILGVDYVYGQVESTGGRLWVVGRDPALFEYFLPEKWRRTPRTILSETPDAFETITKDNIHLVWRISRVGKQSGADRHVDDCQAALVYGYNSPFEEIALSMELSNRGINTTYPRAIYMTGYKPDAAISVVDDSRYKSHREIETPDGHPVLCRHHDHILIWGYWNGSDELLATRDEDVFTRIDALDACGRGYVDQAGLGRIMRAAKLRLAEAGIENLSLRGDHLLLSLERSGRLATDGQGMPAVRICNFELMRPLDSTPAGPD